MAGDTLGDKEFLDLTESEYLELIEAKRLVVLALEAEEVFDLLVQSLVDLEKECVSISVDHMVRRTLHFSEFHQCRRRAASRLNNLLSAGKAYLDQVPSIERNILKDPDSLEFDESTHREYDTRPGYRVMEALRNYAQHRGVPVDSISFDSRLSDDDVHFAHHTRLTLRISRWRERATSWPKTLRLLDELEARADTIELLPLVREYMSGLAVIHEQFRTRTSPTTDRARSLIEKVVVRANAERNGREVPLVAVKLAANGTFVERSNLFLELGRYQRELVERNSHLQNLERRYVTSRLEVRGRVSKQ